MKICKIMLEQKNDETKKNRKHDVVLPVLLVGNVKILIADIINVNKVYISRCLAELPKGGKPTK